MIKIQLLMSFQQNKNVENSQDDSDLQLIQLVFDNKFPIIFIQNSFISNEKYRLENSFIFDMIENNHFERKKNPCFFFLFQFV